MNYRTLAHPLATFRARRRQRGNKRSFAPPRPAPVTCTLACEGRSQGRQLPHFLRPSPCLSRGEKYITSATRQRTLLLAWRRSALVSKGAVAMCPRRPRPSRDSLRWDGKPMRHNLRRRSRAAGGAAWRTSRSASRVRVWRRLAAERGAVVSATDPVARTGRRGEAGRGRPGWGGAGCRIHQRQAANAGPRSSWTRSALRSGLVPAVTGVNGSRGPRRWSAVASLWPHRLPLPAAQLH